MIINHGHIHNLQGSELPRRGILRISSDRDDQGIFWGFKYLILGFFRVVKFSMYFFLGGGGGLDLSRVFFLYLKQFEDS